MSTGHRLAKSTAPGAEVKLADLCTEEWIGEPPDDSGFHVLFRAACEDAGFQPKVEHHSVDTSVQMGFGHQRPGCRADRAHVVPGTVRLGHHPAAGRRADPPPAAARLER